MKELAIIRKWAPSVLLFIACVGLDGYLFLHFHQSLPRDARGIFFFPINALLLLWGTAYQIQHLRNAVHHGKDRHEVLEISTRALYGLLFLALYNILYVGVWFLAL